MWQNIKIISGWVLDAHILSSILCNFSKLRKNLKKLLLTFNILWLVVDILLPWEKREMKVSGQIMRQESSEMKFPGNYIPTGH